MSSYIILCRLTLSNYLLFLFISFRLNCSVGSSDMDLLSSLLKANIVFLAYMIHSVYQYSQQGKCSIR